MISLVNAFERGELPVPRARRRIASMHVARVEGSSPFRGAVLLQGYEQYEMCMVTAAAPYVRCHFNGYITRLRLEGLPAGTEFQVSYDGLDWAVAGISSGAVLDLSDVPTPYKLERDERLAANRAYMSNTFGVSMHHAVPMHRVDNVTLLLGRMVDGVFVRGFVGDATPVTLVGDTVITIADNGCSHLYNMSGYDDMVAALHDGSCRVHYAPPLPKEATLKNIGINVDGLSLPISCACYDCEH